MSSNIYRLDHFGFLKISGVDAVKFLQGYTTCDLDGLKETSVQLGAICNLQGRMLTSFLVVRQETDLILRMDRSLIDKTMQFLNKYIVFSKAKLQDISDSYHCFGRAGKTGENRALCADGDQFTIDLGNRQEIWQPVDRDDAIDPGTNWRDLEIEQGVAWVTESNSEKFLPQMFAYHLLDGIDFNKGCYLGQEIVARMQYRGELKRRLHRIAAVVSNIESGDVVATGSQASLVILNNTTDDVTKALADNEELTAVPIQAA